MSTSKLASRAEAIAPWLAGAILALPNLLVHYPPMADLPLHEAIVGLLRHWGDPRFVPPDVYELNFGAPNQLFYALILAPSYLLGVTWATKLVVAATVFSYPIACAKLADHLGATRWAAVVLTPIALGWMYFWGLLANMIALDLYVFALPFIDRFCDKPTWRSLLVASALGVLMHFAHDMMALTMAGTLVVFTVARRRDLRANVLRVVPAVAIVALAVWARSRSDEIKSSHALAQPPFVWYSLGYKLTSFPGVLYGGYTFWIRNAICAACFAPTLLFAYERWKRRSGAERSAWGRLEHFRFEIVGLGLVLGYLAAPINMRSTTLIYQRFLPPAWTILAIAAAARPTPAAPWRLPRLLASVVPIVPLLTSWPKFLQTDRTFRDLDAIIDRMDEGSTSIVLELGPINDTYWLSNPITGIGHVVARKGGRSIFDFTESPSSPVHIRTDRFWNHIYDRLDGHSYRFMPPFDLTRFRYAILHTTDATIAAVNTIAMEPEAHFVASIGEWTLMESTLPLVPIDAPDALVPLPHPLTLRKRALAVAEKIRNTPLGDDALPPDPSPPSGAP